MPAAMSTHWESSKRPLYIRTVLVNGSRHAILSYEDPLGPNNAPRYSRPNSAHSSRSNYSRESSHENLVPSLEALKNNGKKKPPRDLQACIVKLRLVLATQEKKKLAGKQDHRATRVRSKRKRKGARNAVEKKSRDWQQDADQKSTNNKGEEICGNDEESFKYHNNHNIAVASYFASAEPELQHDKALNNEQDCSCHREEERDCNLTGGSSISSMNVQPGFDVPWNTISAENYFTRPFFNRLSERVLQWLDMANKAKKEHKPLEELFDCKTETITRIRAPTSTRSSSRSRTAIGHRESMEDNAEEVKQEEDIDTAMSSKLTTFSQDLNRQNQLKSEIPEKQHTKAMELQDSIAQSFTTLVSIRSGKYAQKLKINTSTSDRRYPLTRQKNVEESSDEETHKFEPKNSVEQQQNEFKSEKSKKHTKEARTVLDRVIESKVILSKQTFTIPQQISPHLHSRIPWLRDYKSGPFWPVDKSAIKPQLHIFIPALNEEGDVLSDTDSVVSDFAI